MLVKRLVVWHTTMAFLKVPLPCIENKAFTEINSVECSGKNPQYVDQLVRSIFAEYDKEL